MKLNIQNIRKKAKQTVSIEILCPLFHLEDRWLCSKVSKDIIPAIPTIQNPKQNKAIFKGPVCWFFSVYIMTTATPIKIGGKM